MNSLHSAIAKRFPPPEWAVLYEVRDDAGFNAVRGLEPAKVGAA